MPVDLDLGDDRDDRSRALGIGDAAPGQGIAIAVEPRRGTRLPLGALGRGFDDGEGAAPISPVATGTSRFATGA